MLFFKNGQVKFPLHCFHEKMNRRRFLYLTGKISAVAAVTGTGMAVPSWLTPLARSENEEITSLDRLDRMEKVPEARYYISTKMKDISCVSCHLDDEKLKGRKIDHGAGIVQCRLCAQECMILPGDRGACNARINVEGTLRSLVYGRPVSVHVDPIEKKPFYHYLPGSTTFSMATAGCPLSCKFCQNWEISQAKPEDFRSSFTPPKAIVEAARRQKAPVIAFTYNEPTVFAEYLIDIACLAKEQNIRSVLVSCGFMNEAPLDDMCEVIDAIKIDLKGFSNNFYQKVCGASLDPVLRSIWQVRRRRVHLEIVNLVVPTLNDSDKMMSDLCCWIADELGADVPVHFTRFHPDYQMRNLPPTPLSTLEKAWEMAKEAGIHYPYVGNYPRHPGNHTYCPQCGKAVIERIGFFITSEHLTNGHCEYCNASISGVWA